MNHKKNNNIDKVVDKRSEKPLISVEDAEKIIAAFPVSIKIETVPLLAAQNRVLAADIDSPFAMPEFDKSAMDGYAYISDDRSPAFKIIETIAAGTPPRLAVTPGQCAKIMTGAMLPSGADRVVKRECTREENGFMKIVAVDKNRNIRCKGEDLQAGQQVLTKGTLLQAAQIALLASLGHAEVPTARPPRVGIITTGSELAEPGSPLGPGQIYNSNYYSLAAQIHALGAEPLAMGRIPDNAAATVESITSCLNKCEVLILSGGVSAGDFDFVPTAMKQAGVTLHFEKIAVQPGMPTVFGSRAEKIVFGLPGNPVSTFVIFEIFIKPLLLRLMGHASQPLIMPAVLTEAYSRSNGTRTAFVPVRYSLGLATVLAYHGSGHLHALSRANALLRVPAGQLSIPAGSTADVRYL
jgi:molybdopterin molybdotransferase